MRQTLFLSLLLLLTLIFSLAGQAAVCGDGVLDLVETCDDGNLLSGDGCDSFCDTELYWECSGEPSQCTDSGFRTETVGFNAFRLNDLAINEYEVVLAVGNNRQILAYTGTPTSGTTLSFGGNFMDVHAPPGANGIFFVVDDQGELYRYDPDIDVWQTLLETDHSFTAITGNQGAVNPDVYIGGISSDGRNVVWSFSDGLNLVEVLELGHTINAIEAKDASLSRVVIATGDVNGGETAEWDGSQWEVINQTVKLYDVHIPDQAGVEAYYVGSFGTFLRNNFFHDLGTTNDIYSIGSDTVGVVTQFLGDSRGRVFTPSGLVVSPEAGQPEHVTGLEMVFPPPTDGSRRGYFTKDLQGQGGLFKFSTEVPDQQYCGDGFCNGDEDQFSCPQDCSSPGDVCDRDQCFALCGGYTTQGSSQSCIESCATISPEEGCVAGHESCDPQSADPSCDEQLQNCLEITGQVQCQGSCGNNVCEQGEQESCPQDCQQQSGTCDGSEMEEICTVLFAIPEDSLFQCVNQGTGSELIPACDVAHSICRETNPDPSFCDEMVQQCYSSGYCQDQPQQCVQGGGPDQCVGGTLFDITRGTTDFCAPLGTCEGTTTGQPCDLGGQECNCESIASQWAFEPAIEQNYQLNCPQGPAQACEDAYADCLGFGFDEPLCGQTRDTCIDLTQNCGSSSQGEICTVPDVVQVCDCGQSCEIFNGQTCENDLQCGTDGECALTGTPIVNRYCVEPSQPGICTGESDILTQESCDLSQAGCDYQQAALLCGSYADILGGTEIFQQFEDECIGFLDGYELAYPEEGCDLATELCYTYGDPASCEQGRDQCYQGGYTCESQSSTGLICETTFNEFIKQCKCAVTDEDGDGVPDEYDLCVGTLPDTMELGPNQYGQLDLSGPFETGPESDQSLVYTMAETNGCSCEQIVDLLGKGTGHTAKGCSPSVMEEFTSLNSEPDRKAGIGRRAKPNSITGSVVSDIADGLGPEMMVGLIGLLVIAGVVMHSHRKNN